MELDPFQLELIAHRSLSPSAFAVLFGSVAAINFLGGAVLWYVGAWPVVGFMGLDIALIWFGFHWSFNASLKKEKIIITRYEMRIERYFGDRVVEVLHFGIGFFQLELERDAERGTVGRLVVRSR